MKKILSCALCVVLAVCSVITADAAQTVNAPCRAKSSSILSGDEELTYSMFLDYLNSPDGYANTDVIRAAVNKDDYSNTWAKRDGILGYDIVDMNGDGINDLMIYSFDDDGNDNAILARYCSFNKKGVLVDDDCWEIYSKSADWMDYYTGANEYCVGGIIERNGKKGLLVESYYTPYPAVDYHLSYCILECTPNGGLDLADFVTIDDAYMNIIVGTLLDNGEYNVDYRSFNGFAGIKTALIDIGLPNNPKNSSTIGTTLGCDTTDQIYTYFNTSYEKQSFYMVSNFTRYSNGYDTLNYVNYAGMYPKQSKPADAALGSGTKYGDLDGDNLITSADSLLILRASVQLENL